MGSAAGLFAAMRARRQMKQGQSAVKTPGASLSESSMTGSIDRALGFNLLGKHDYHTMNRPTQEQHPFGDEPQPYTENNPPVSKRSAGV